MYIREYIEGFLNAQSPPGTEEVGDFRGWEILSGPAPQKGAANGATKKGIFALESRRNGATAKRKTRRHRGFRSGGASIFRVAQTLHSILRVSRCSARATPPCR